MKSKLYAILLISYVAMSASSALASDWYPSPTGWRGPIREAGRPWLAGYAYPRTSSSRTYARRHYRSYPTHGARAYATQANIWHYDGSIGCYWLYDSSSRYYWYYNPATRQYTYVIATR